MYIHIYIYTWPTIDDVWCVLKWDLYPPVLDFGVAINFQQTHVDMAAACRSHSQSEKKR